MGEPIVVATDSGANLPRALAEQFGIEVIPLWVQIDDQSYRDGVDITPLEFFRRLKDKVRGVRSSQPSPGEFVKFYQRLQEKAEAVVSVHVGGQYSGVLDAARSAAAELSPFLIEVIDTGTVAMAQGFVALAAARAVEAGESLMGVVEKVREIVPKVDLIAALETVEYAVKGGRVAAAARLLNSVLQIKPLVRVQGNQVGIIGQARTRGRVVGRMMDELAERVGDAPLHVAVLYTDAVDEAQRIKDEIVSRFNCVEVYVEAAAPVLGVHAGPGAVGLAYYPGE
ncbi:MAG: DegV family protein [Anaerolineae bacterium]